MIKGIYTAARSLEYKVKNIDVIANNLANLSTTGYKREIPFSEVINQMGDVQIKKLSSQRQGDVLLTANPLDMAISGKGFFAVKNDEGNIELTRNGRFKISDEGFLVDSSNQKVLGKNGPISMEDTMQNKDSVILVTKAGEIKVGDKTIDTLLIMNVDDSTQLARSDDSNFATDGQQCFAAPETDYGISQGYLEGANTNAIEEMEAMIQLNKEYESAQKIIASLDKSLAQANEIGKV
ncbi:MAG: flagellar hook basal-body protein [Ignavibacteriales bacterium]|nr:flagellar hook basal-body protein [Ignavibacteriales bacterium]